MWSNAPEEELSVEVTDINGIHIDDMYVFEPGEREVSQNLAAKPSCTDDENLALCTQELLHLQSWHRSKHDLSYVIISEDTSGG